MIQPQNYSLKNFNEIKVFKIVNKKLKDKIKYEQSPSQHYNRSQNQTFLKSSEIHIISDKYFVKSLNLHYISLQ